MKAFYIFSFYNNGDLDYDWFVGEDFENYANQTKEVCKFMVKENFAENIIEASEMLNDVYKQDTSVLIKQLKG